MTAWETYITIKMDLKEIGYRVVDWVQLVLGIVQEWEFVKMWMKGCAF
jgi:transcription antitermination factor NusG